MPIIDQCPARHCEGNKGMPHFLPWEERTSQRKQDKGQKDTAKSSAAGPKEAGLPRRGCGQEGTDELDFAEQAG